MSANNEIPSVDGGVAAVARNENQDVEIVGSKSATIVAEKSDRNPLEPEGSSTFTPATLASKETKETVGTSKAPLKGISKFGALRSPRAVPTSSLFALSRMQTVGSRSLLTSAGTSSTAARYMNREALKQAELDRRAHELDLKERELAIMQREVELTMLEGHLKGSSSVAPSESKAMHEGVGVQVSAPPQKLQPSSVPSHAPPSRSLSGQETRVALNAPTPASGTESSDLRVGGEVRGGREEEDPELRLPFKRSRPTSPDASTHQVYPEARPSMSAYASARETASPQDFRPLHPHSHDGRAGHQHGFSGPAGQYSRDIPLATSAGTNPLFRDGIRDYGENNASHQPRSYEGGAGYPTKNNKIPDERYYPSQPFPHDGGPPFDRFERVRELEKIARSLDPSQVPTRIPEPPLHGGNRQYEGQGLGHEVSPFVGTPKNITIDTTKAPKFHAVQGLITWLHFRASFQAFFASNSHKLANDPRLQYAILLGMCASEAELIFIRDHSREIVTLCPESVEFLANLRTGASSLDFASSLACKGGPSHTNAFASTSALSNIQIANRAREATLARGLLEHGASAASSYANKDVLEGSTFELLPAFTIVAERTLSKPTTPEMQIWETGMVLTKSTALHPNVSKSEGPSQFMDRVLTTHDLFTKYDPNGMSQIEGRSGPLTIYIRGMPQHENKIFEIMRDIPQSAPNTHKMGVIAGRLQTRLEFESSPLGEMGSLSVSKAPSGNKEQGQIMQKPPHWRTQTQNRGGHNWQKGNEGPRDLQGHPPQQLAIAAATAQQQAPSTQYPATMHPRGQNRGNNHQAPQHTAVVPQGGGGGNNYNGAPLFCVFCPSLRNHNTEDCGKRPRILAALQARPELMRMPPAPASAPAPASMPASSAAQAQATRNFTPPRGVAAVSAAFPQDDSMFLSRQMAEEAGFTFPDLTYASLCNSQPPASHSTAPMPTLHNTAQARTAASARSEQDVRIAGVAALRWEDVHLLEEEALKSYSLYNGILHPFTEPGPSILSYGGAEGEVENTPYRTVAASSMLWRPNRGVPMPVFDPPWDHVDKNKSVLEQPLDRHEIDGTGQAEAKLAAENAQAQPDPVPRGNIPRISSLLPSQQQGYRPTNPEAPYETLQHDPYLQVLVPEFDIPWNPDTHKVMVGQLQYEQECADYEKGRKFGDHDRDTRHLADPRLRPSLNAFQFHVSNMARAPYNAGYKFAMKTQTHNILRSVAFPPAANAAGQGPSFFSSLPAAPPNNGTREIAAGMGGPSPTRSASERDSYLGIERSYLGPGSLSLNPGEAQPLRREGGGASDDPMRSSKIDQTQGAAPNQGLERAHPQGLSSSSSCADKDQVHAAAGVAGPRIPQYRQQQYGESFQVAPLATRGTKRNSQHNEHTARGDETPTTDLDKSPTSPPYNRTEERPPPGDEPESFIPLNPPARNNYFTATTTPRMAMQTHRFQELKDLWSYWKTMKDTNRQGTLRYFLNDPDEPSTNVSLIYKGMRTTWGSTFMDDGANIDMMDESVRSYIGVPVLPSSVRLATSTSTSSNVLGMTPPITIEYGQGRDAIRVIRPFLVVEGMKGVYDILICNQDTQSYKGIINAGANTYTLHKDGQALVLPTTSKIP